MRVLLINDHAHFSGGGDAVLHLERNLLIERGVGVKTFAFASEASETLRGVQICRESRLEFFRKLGKFIYAFGVEAALVDTLKEFAPDVVHVHLVSKYPLGIFSALRYTPTVYTLHGPNHFCSTSWGCIRSDSSPCDLGIGLKCWKNDCVSMANALAYTQLDRRLAPLVKSSVNHFVTPSLHLAETARRLGYTPVTHIPLGIDREFLSPPIATPLTPPILVFAGALIEQKGVRYLLEAMPFVAEAFPDVVLHIAGRGPLEQELQLLASTLGVTRNVKFLGFIGRSELIRQYQNAYVVIVPSIWKETFGLIGPEALASGAPCIGTNDGGIPEWLKDGEFGFLVPPRDPAALAERIIRLLKDPGLRQRFASSGRNYALRTHDPDVYVDALMDIFDRAISDNSFRAGD